jgi:BirA family biotin operon repressor/biotin-[acetyl-CoA-carboxylase] ligase
VGIGLNVNQEKFPPELSGIASSLRVESGKPQSRLELLVRLLREFETDYNRFLVEGGASVISRFCGLSSFAQGLRVRVTNGKDSFTGVTTGLSPEGSLLVKRDGGPIVTVIAGDVTEDRSILVVDSRSMNRIKDTMRSREEPV